MGEQTEPAGGTGAGAGRAALVAGDVEFAEADAELLRAIARTGSVASAAHELERSRARATWRIEALEEAFGPLVTRRRGGDGGGGSQLTDEARSLLDRYDRLTAAVNATARIPETVLSGIVHEVGGELATVQTEIGEIQGVHEEIGRTESVQVRIGADAITLHDHEQAPAPDTTSARNRRTGQVVSLDRGETVHTAEVDVDGTLFRTLVTDESADRLALGADRTVLVSWKATATRIAASTRE